MNSKTQKIKKTLSIFHFNDVYDIEGYTEEPVGGASRFVTQTKKFHEKHPEDGLILFSGDLFSPSPLSLLYKGEQMIEPINACRIDVACVGNHEFDFSIEVAEKLFQKCNFPWLCSNVFNIETNCIFANNNAYSILEKNGLVIGIMGLAEADWLNSVSEIDLSLVKYEDFVACGRRLTKIMKEQYKCDLIIALTHMRVPNDIKLGQEVPEIDLILGGHDHIITQQVINSNILIKSGSDFRQYSIIDIEFMEDLDTEEEENKGKQQFIYIKKNNLKLKVITQFFEVTKNIKKDEQVQKIVDIYVLKSKELMEKVIGHSHVDLETRFDKIRTQETNFCNFYADVIRSEVQADICILNAGAIRSDCIFQAGPISYSMLNKALPFSDIITVQEVSGLKVLQALENGVSKWPAFEGRFPCVSGIKFKFDPKKQPFQRINSNDIWVGNQLLDLNKQYKVALKWFISQGKDGYDMFQDQIQQPLQRRQSQVFQCQCENNSQNVKTFDRRKSRIERQQSSQLIQEFKQIGDDQFISIAPKVEGRIEIIQ
ncbi:ser thr protein phosphatase family protein, putative [Ichthyophthirius multifiliis]|uniref:Ser thr protein phosphatase family protein, putative n=1 Tax=Ichthyophthirius multifiliis TaxID=5932 RepID=G0R101_ICHMU|nr:ser thr protein phosphatase family protein, putative [Ichthyophthirius multifiliis]EGR28866.1 ser thr protein phosphatase family protein, putative [Ichthyophthirius multifiliis]|eukprot:XP_004030102.1 ser thr protein phosphatase family protein, putative [Ichthyophthirius multifiliis]